MWEYLPRNKNLRPGAAQMRREGTREEKELWYRFLHNYPIRFNRQRIIGNYIADFYSSKARLVIEVDGNQHFSPEAMEYDRERTKYFKAMDIDVIRFTNQEVAQQFQSVCDRIDCAVKERMKVLHH